MESVQLNHEVQVLKENLREWMAQHCVPMTPTGVQEFFLMLCVRPEVVSALMQQADPWMQKVGRLYFSTAPVTL